MTINVPQQHYLYFSLLGFFKKEIKLTKKNSLFILQLPPPIHGSSTMGDLIKKSFKS